MSVGANFALKTTLKAYTISASAGAGGTISPSGSVSVTAGSSRSFTITPAAGYKVYYLRIDGKTITTSNAVYTFSNVNAAHTISAYFTKK
jgi:hypothetical protein